MRRRLAATVIPDIVGTPDITAPLETAQPKNSGFGLCGNTCQVEGCGKICAKTERHLDARTIDMKEVAVKLKKKLQKEAVCQCSEHLRMQNSSDDEAQEKEGRIEREREKKKSRRERRKRRKKKRETRKLTKLPHQTAR